MNISPSPARVLALASIVACLCSVLCRPLPAAPPLVRVATYNVENYLEQAIGNRPMKTPEARARVRESLRALNADVVALQEMGGTNALFELRAALATEGLAYPYWDHVTGPDTNIHLAILSRVPITARRAHTNESFLLFGRRYRVSRGFAEVDLQVNSRYSFTLISAHLKSRRAVPEADEAELREQEALRLRELIDARLQARPNANLIVLGDFNDTKDSRPIRTLIARGRHALIDIRPAERNGDARTDVHGGSEPRCITWTHHYAKEDSYSRIDYILVSRGMAREWVPEQTRVLALPGWGDASDHRPIVAGFIAEDQ